jgi:hypothetical protein
MKKILLNGCSFVAGDAIAWDKYYPDIDWKNHNIFENKHDKYSIKEIKDFSNKYKWELRKNHNLSSYLRNNLNVEVTDLSQDGNSNDTIALETMNWLSQLSLEEQQQYHVCIGWSNEMRRRHWVELDNSTSGFNNLSPWNLNSPPFYNEQTSDYIKASIVNANDQDHIYNYFTNILLLQNYLKSRGIKYTFWRSLGQVYKKEDIKLFHRCGGIIDSTTEYDKFFDDSDWINFNKINHSWISDTWLQDFSKDKKSNWISDTNQHPNIKAVAEFSVRLIKHIGKN